MLPVFANIASVFAIILIGFLAARTKRITPEVTKDLSWLLINIATPCMVLYSMSRQEFTMETFPQVWQTAVLMLSAMVLISVLSIPVVRLLGVEQNDRGIYRIMLALTNNGFMGYPLSLAVFGQQGLFLMIIANSMFNIYFYSIGIWLMIYDRQEAMHWKQLFRAFLSPPLIASITGLVIFFAGFRFPGPGEQFLQTVGSMMVPLSMIIIGIQLSASNARRLLTNHALTTSVMLRLVAVPAFLFLLFLFLPLEPMALLTVIFAMSMPMAAASVVIAELYGANTRLAAEAVFLTTLLSLATLPVVALLLTAWLAGSNM